MPAYTDQLGRQVFIATPPQRIVSLVPSLTELLYTLELGEQVAGITRFCVHPPEWRHSKTRIGGTKQLHIDAIRALQPDLIIASKEENIREQVEALASFAPVWVSDINNLAQAIAAIETIGQLCNRQQAAIALNQQILDGFHQLPVTKTTIPVAYCIWKDPYMIAGGGTFINDMLERCGWTNVFAGQPRYPVVSLPDIQQSGCRLLLLSSEPYPFTMQHATLLQPLLPGIAIQPVNGEMFSWYGSRLREAVPYFQQLMRQFSVPS